jgi:RNA polymerase sigma-70 factor (ECF subfamily)
LPVKRKTGKEEYVMKRFFFLLVIFSLTHFPVLTAGDNVSVKTMPPVVIKTVPQSGDTGVDPYVKEIRVTFSKEMMTNNQWSWVKISGETFPEIAGKIHYLKDRKTCVLPVKLKPGKTYVIWINSGKYNYFKDPDGNSAIPYLLVFETER